MDARATYRERIKSRRPVYKAILALTRNIKDWLRPSYI